MVVCVVSTVCWPPRLAGLAWDVVFGEEAGFLDPRSLEFTEDTHLVCWHVLEHGYHIHGLEDEVDWIMRLYDWRH
jgi:hypothetical protein